MITDTFQAKLIRAADHVSELSALEIKLFAISRSFSGQMTNFYFIFYFKFMFFIGNNTTTVDPIKHLLPFIVRVNRLVLF
jgi:hypothetical protein